MSDKMLDAAYGIDRKNGGGLIPNHNAYNSQMDAERRRTRQLVEMTHRFTPPVVFQTVMPFNFPSSTPVYNLTGMMEFK